MSEYQRTSVASCHAIGKDWTTAKVVCWFITSYEDSIAITTAPTDRQVRLLLWGEIARDKARSKVELPGRLNLTEWKIGPGHYAIGFKSKDQDPERFAGFHAKHLLYAVDEASGVPDTIFEAIEGGMSGGDARLLMIGNPLQAGGQFYRAHHNERKLHKTIQIGFQDSPNYLGKNPDGSWVTEGELRGKFFIQPGWAEEMRQKWGEDNPLYQARVLGQFPAEGVNTLISLLWIMAAQESGDVQGRRFAHVPRQMGVDVARFGGDESSLYIRSGAKYIHHEAWTSRDTMFTANRVFRAIEEHDVKTVCVDGVGVGGGVVDRLREMQEDGKIKADVQLLDVQVGMAPPLGDEMKYAQLRDFLWWNLRQAFKEGQVSELPEDETLAGQLSGILYAYDTKGRLKVESKDDMKKRGMDSPDRAEAMMLAYYPQSEPMEETGAVEALEDMEEIHGYFAGIEDRML